MNKDDCIDCVHYYGCSRPCLYLVIIRQLSGMKNSPLLERLAPPDINDKTYQVDYKEILSERRQARSEHIPITIKEVRETKGTLQRAVAAMLYADLTIKEISEIIDRSESTVRRICQK